jgi:hypothetical protein
MRPIRVLVTGSRDVDGRAEAIVLAALEDAQDVGFRANRPMVVVHGAARGVDTVAGFWAAAVGVEVERYPADWERQGKRAGLLRNVAMVQRGADICLAFPRRASVGTWHCIRYAADQGIPVRVFPLPEIVS